jgi:hypothetical protein
MQRRRLAQGTTVLAALACAAGTLSAATPGVRARAWTPFVRLTAGKGEDAPRLATVRIREGLGTLHTLLNGLDVDDPTRSFFAKIMGQLESFDLAALYETLPDAEAEGGWRRVRFTGQSAAGKYSIRRLASEDKLVVSPDNGVGAHFGDLALAFRSRKAETPGTDKETDNYIGNLKLGLGFGNASWSQLVGAIVDELKLIESTAPGMPKIEATRRPEKDSIARVKKDNPRLQGEDLEIVALFCESYPGLYEHLTELYRTDDVLVYDPDNTVYRQIHLVLSVRRDSPLHRPVIEWLEGLGPLMSGRLEITDKKGRIVATIRFSSKELALTFDLFVANGKICPVDSGQVLTEEAYDLEAITKAEHTDRWNFDMDVNGIVTEIHDLKIKVAYEAGAQGMRCRMVHDECPKVRVHGSAFGVIPTWAIDVLIPGNMEELTTSFLRTVATGNDGKGLVMDLDSRLGQSGASVLTFDMQGEGLNNFLVRLGFKLARRKLIPPDDAFEDLSEYLKKGHRAFVSDFETFAADCK